MVYKIKYRIFGEEKDDKPIIRHITIKAKSKKAAIQTLSKRFATKSRSGRVTNIKKTRTHRRQRR